MNTSDMNSILRRIENSKFKIHEILQELDDIEETVIDMKKKNDENN